MSFCGSVATEESRPFAVLRVTKALLVFNVILNEVKDLAPVAG
jgi:hypothetical protein